VREGRGSAYLGNFPRWEPRTHDVSVTVAAKVLRHLYIFQCSNKAGLFAVSLSPIGDNLPANICTGEWVAERDWTDAGHGWQGKATTPRMVGWSRQRRVVLLRRKLDRPRQHLRWNLGADRDKLHGERGPMDI
jgi:hypothetical protein